MIYDCFTFFNELDLLEIRLNTLKDVVDRFVISEATRTHTGKPKELVFDKNRDRFAKFSNKIEYVVVDNLIPEEEVLKDSYNLPWVNENRQRNALIRGMQGAHDDDIVMISDVDEIPRPESVVRANKDLKGAVSSVRLELRSYNFYINYENHTCPKWLLGTIAVKYGDFISGELLAGVKYDRYTQRSENQWAAPHKLRFLKPDITIGDAGWHFSFLGGIDAIQRKLVSFSHSEFGAVPKEILEDRLRRGCDLFGRNGKFFGVPIDSSFPKYILENQTALRKLIFHIDEEYLRQTKFARVTAKIRGLSYRFIVMMVPNSLAPFIVRVRDIVMKKLGRI